jgi:hypothetical protein
MKIFPCRHVVIYALQRTSQELNITIPVINHHLRNLTFVKRVAVRYNLQVRAPATLLFVMSK